MTNEETIARLSLGIAQDKGKTLRMSLNCNFIEAPVTRRVEPRTMLAIRRTSRRRVLQGSPYSRKSVFPKVDDGPHEEIVRDGRLFHIEVGLEDMPDVDGTILIRQRIG